jgi:hypothetical protein
LKTGTKTKGVAAMTISKSISDYFYRKKVTHHRKYDESHPVFVTDSDHPHGRPVTPHSDLRKVDSPSKRYLTEEL